MKLTLDTYIKIHLTVFLIAIAASVFAQEKPMDVPQNFRDMAPADTTNIADIRWKDFIAEPDLQQLIATAVQKNSDLQIAEKNIAIANLQYKQARWANVPQLGANAGASSTRLSNNSLNGKNMNALLGQKHIDDFSAGLTLSWEADIWGKMRNQKKSARAAYLQTAEARKALQTAIVAQVSNGFYDLLMLDAQLAIARKTLQLNDSTVFMVNLQYDAGQVNLLAKQQTEAQRLVAAQLIPQIEQSIEMQENALSVLSGSFPAAQQRQSLLDEVMVKDGLASGIPSQLLSKRPDVKSAELALRVANAKVGITKAYLYPALTITAAGGANAYEFDNWFNLPASLFGNVAGGLTAPLLNGRRLHTQYDVAKVEREQAALAFRQSVLVAVGEVSDALVRIDKQEQRYDIAYQRVETLKKSITNANLLFKNGMATYLEVIIAQGSLLQAELELAAIKKERLAANIELYRALGGGWE